MFGVKANSVALLGKAPCQGDFIRWNALDPVSQQFHKWLEEGHEVVRRANLTPQPSPSASSTPRPAAARPSWG